MLCEESRREERGIRSERVAGVCRLSHVVQRKLKGDGGGSCSSCGIQSMS